MSKKLLILLAVIMFIGASITVEFFQRSKSKNNSYEDHTIHSITPTSIAKTDGENMIDGTPGTVGKKSSQTSISQSVGRTKRQRFTEALQMFDKPEAAKSPLEGMISPQLALKSAMQYITVPYQTNPPPSVSLIKDVYIIEFWKLHNPFRARRQLDFLAGVDAWNGDFLDIYKQHGSMQFYWLDKETRKSEEKIRQMKSIVMELDNRANESQLAQPELQQGMVSPEQAISVAQPHVEARNYDRERKPDVYLVDGVYMVVFWRHHGSTARHHKKLYDTRVAIDAITGEYIGTEITHDP